ncbi:hypothetical protein BDW02DRAFT_116872 [Decorospora gaudefroyi]|uniref:XPG-I domain-containing protein n=1 Tax=Decorospora gaudefroyi TaxID=184978 RepID=A0A6A5JYQ3_9PLEO|nr:hypothetical protein BDW02DRAFT_116872 [Decorospora gaudefroyi]
MGLPALWDMIRRHEESIPMAQLAEEHHRRHGKPLRIAVDEADWRFNNLTAQQVYTIRETSKEAAFQGIEKAMFYRICRLLTLGIQLIVVFDGPGRPWKRGKRGQCKINFEERRLLKDMLTCFGMPYHEAPGEAEAECARLQVLGMVDAVWSQDSDCLMFGCQTWIHDDRIAKEKGNTDRSKENTKKNAKYARVVKARDMQEKYGLDREGLVLFAMLVGGDYDKGLPQCGPSTAIQAAKRGLGRSLCACRSQGDCDLWTVELAVFLQTTSRGRSIPIPPAFPDYKTLKKYYSPKVSSDEQLLNNSRLNLDCSRPIQESKLLEVMSSRFNIWGRLYMNWVGPVLLTQSLMARDPLLPKEAVHEIRITKSRAKKIDDQPPMRILERKLTFSPFGITAFARTDFEGDRLGYWNGNMEDLFDPTHRVECEIPEYWLRKVLPPDVLDPPPAPPKRTPKRKRQAGGDDEEVIEASTTTKRRRNVKQAENPGTLPSKALASPATQANTQQLPDFLQLTESEDEMVSRQPPNIRSRVQAPIFLTPSHVFDIGSSEPSEDEADLPVSSCHASRTPSRMNRLAEAGLSEMLDEEDEDMQLALRLSMQGRPTNGEYDSIFAMREAGRKINGQSVPSWSMDKPTSPTARPASDGEIPPARSNRSGHSTGVTRLAAGRVEPAPVYIPDRSLTQNATIPSTSDTGHVAYSESSLSTYCEVSTAEIRAARLRHFATSSATPTLSTKDTRKPLPSPPTVKPKKRATTTYQLPAGVDCIDLTDD